MANLFPAFKPVSRALEPSNLRLTGVSHDRDGLRRGFRSIRSLPAGSTVFLEGVSPERAQERPFTRYDRWRVAADRALMQEEPDYFGAMAEYAKRRGHKVVWTESPKAFRLSETTLKNSKEYVKLVRDAMRNRQGWRDLSHAIQRGAQTPLETDEKLIKLENERAALQNQKLDLDHRAMNSKTYLFARWRSEWMARAVLRENAKSTERPSAQLFLVGDAHVPHLASVFPNAVVDRFPVLEEYRKDYLKDEQSMDKRTALLEYRRRVGKLAFRLFQTAKTSALSPMERVQAWWANRKNVFQSATRPAYHPPQSRPPSPR